VDVKGDLSVWKLPDDIKIPPCIAPPDLQRAPIPAIPPPSATHPPPELLVKTPDHLRGFPKTTLTQVLNLIVSDGDQNPMPGIQLEIHNNLDGTTFGTGNATDKFGFYSSIKVLTDDRGKAAVSVHLGEKPGKGTITITASGNGLTKTEEVSLEAIDENATLQQPQNVSSGASAKSIMVNWSDKPDNRTAFLIQRRVDKGLWRAIAIVPETATSYVDFTIIENQEYYYGVAATNDSKYGYPAKFPPPPDRLGNFLP